MKKHRRRTPSAQPVRAPRKGGLALTQDNWWIHWNERAAWPTMCRSPQCDRCRKSQER